MSDIAVAAPRARRPRPTDGHLADGTGADHQHAVTQPVPCRAGAVERDLCQADPRRHLRGNGIRRADEPVSAGVDHAVRPVFGERDDPLAHLVAASLVGDLHHAHGTVARVEGILHPLVPVRARIEQAVENDVLRPGAHQRVLGANEHLVLPGRPEFKGFQVNFLLVCEYQAVRLHGSSGHGVLKDKPGFVYQACGRKTRQRTACATVCDSPGG